VSRADVALRRDNRIVGAPLVGAAANRHADHFTSDGLERVMLVH
jgi:hypothetical protein